MHTQSSNSVLMSAGPQGFFCQKKSQQLASGWIRDISAGGKEIAPNLS